MGLIKKILKMGVASKMADDYGVFPAAMYLANSKPDADDEMCDISLTEDVSQFEICLLYTSPSPRDRQKSRMPSTA